MYLFRTKESKFKSIKSENLSSAQISDLNSRTKTSLKYSRFAFFNCCRFPENAVEDNLEHIGLGDTGETAVISVSPKRKQYITPSGETYVSQEPTLLTAVASHNVETAKEKIVVTNNVKRDFRKDELSSDEPLTKQSISLPFRKVQSTGGPQPFNKVNQDKPNEHVALSRQRFSLLPFRRRDDINVGTNLEKVFSDVGTEYAVVKVVSKLDYAQR